MKGPSDRPQVAARRRVARRRGEHRKRRIVLALIDVLEAEEVNLATRREEDDVKALDAFGSRQLGNEIAERGDPSSIDAAMQMILAEHRHDFGLAAGGPIVAQKELLNHRLATKRQRAE